MGRSGEFFARGMAVSIHKFALVDPYLDCGCTKSDDTPLFIVLLWKGVR